MKAAILHEFKKPLVIQEVERPAPGADEVLIKVEACGVCRSDLHVAGGDWTQFARIVKRPLVLGHEVAGRVVEKGTAVRDLQLGDRVGVGWIHWTCGECELCCNDAENLCSRHKITGVMVDGGYAEFIKAPASHVVRIPDKLSSAAPLFCAGVTVYRALRRSGIAKNQTLAVFGIGGLGDLAVQIGHSMVLRSSPSILLTKSSRWRSLSALPRRRMRALVIWESNSGSGGVQVALVTSASKAAYGTAFSSLRPTGTLLMIGLPAENICFPPILMSAREIHIRASAVGTREDLRQVLDMAGAGKVRCEVSTRPLADVNDVFEELSRGRVNGRIVLLPN